MPMYRDPNTGEYVFIDDTGNVVQRYRQTDPNKMSPYQQSAQREAGAMNPLEAMMAGAGKKVADIGVNVHNMMAGVSNNVFGNNVDLKNPPDPTLTNALHSEHPIAATIGEMIPDFVAPGARGRLGAGPIGAVVGAFTGDPRDSLAQRMAEGAFGEFAGREVLEQGGRLVNRLFGRRVGAVTDEQKAVEKLLDSGYKLTPGQMRGGMFEKIDTAMMESASGSPVFDAMNRHNTRLFNERLGKAMGLPRDSWGDYVTRDNLNEAISRNGDRFEAIGQALPQNIDLSSGLADRLKEFGFSKEMRAEFMDEFGRDLDDALTDLTGPELMHIRSNTLLGALSKKGQKKKYRMGLVQRIDEELFNQMPKTPDNRRLIAEWSEARNQFDFLRQMDKMPDDDVLGFSPGRVATKFRAFNARYPELEGVISDAKTLSSDAIPYKPNYSKSGTVTAIDNPAIWGLGFGARPYTALVGPSHLGGRKPPGQALSAAGAAGRGYNTEGTEDEESPLIDNPYFDLGD